MKYLKDIKMDELKINELVDYADMKDVDLEKEILNILSTGIDSLYKKLVPKDRQLLIEKKIAKQNQARKSKTDAKTNLNFKSSYEKPIANN